MNLQGEKPQDFQPAPRPKRKPKEPTASTSFETTNYFAVLSDSDTETESIESTPPNNIKKKRIPRIVLYSFLSNHTQTLKSLNDKLTSPVEIKTKTNRFLLYIQTEKDYETLLREVKQANLAYHTYPLPQTQQPRLVLKGLPPNITIEEIREDLQMRNLQVTHARQLIRMDKHTEQILQKYPIFVVTFQATTDLREVYKTNKICHCIVSWERYKPKRPIAQCFQCQQFGHSSAYCGRPPKCVKCGKLHQTSDCKKQTSEPPTCANCGGYHPANYSGCPEYQKRLTARNRTPHLQQQTQPPPPPPHRKAAFPSTTSTREPPSQTRTWTQIAAQTSRPQQDQTLPTFIGSIKSILSAFNLQALGTVLQNLATQLRNAKDRMEKMMLLVDTLMAYFILP